MNIAGIKYNDIADGPGVRTTVFVSGCRRHCRGCHNPETWVELDTRFIDVIVKRYIEWRQGRFDDVFVIRDGQKLRFDEVTSFEAEEVEA